MLLGVVTIGAGALGYLWRCRYRRMERKPSVADLKHAVASVAARLRETRTELKTMSRTALSALRSLLGWLIVAGLVAAASITGRLRRERRLARRGQGGQTGTPRP